MNVSLGLKMKLHTIHSLIGITFLASAITAANAADTGFYVGGGLGASYASKMCDDTPSHVLGLPITNCDDKDFAWKLLGGYQFNPIFGVEAFYTNLGTFKANASGTSSLGTGSIEAKSKMSGFGLAATAGWPINQQFSIFGKAGFVHTKAERPVSIKGKAADGTLVNISESNDSDGNSFMAGAGVKYSFNENLSARLEWEFFNEVGKDDDKKVGNKSFDGIDIHLFSASLIYAF